MARDPLVGMLMGKSQRGRRARRRYDLALNTQGVEMQLPSLPRVRLGWRLFALSLVALMGVLLYQFWNEPTYQVGDVQISGLRRVSRSDVNDAIEVIGEPIFTIDHLALEQQLPEDFPEFSAVAVSLEFPDTVFITVTERVPVLAWSQDGDTQLVDESGLPFPLRNEASESRLPVVEAEDAPPLVPAADLPVPSPALLLDEERDEIEESDEQQMKSTEQFPLLSPEMVSAILTLAERAPQGAVLRYSTEHGLYWRDPGEWEVYFGDGREMQMKLLVYDAIYTHLDAIDTRPSVISVEYVHAPYYRLGP
jgi:cell division septal protein FtsQ